ncbi:MAG: hypothetical protein HZB98_05640 [Bacteroidia bacterium]|nr:hypothetical protein [Bacteroidia bacterium]
MKLRPAVDKATLVFMAGLMWSGVGAMLISYSVHWLIPLSLMEVLAFGIAGIVVAFPIYYFGFLRLANKNLNRLLPLTEKRCLFSFMTWKSYLIVPVMVSMGIFLRHSPIPKTYLSVIYSGIGLGLFFSGIWYFRFFRMLLQENPKTNK